VSGDAPHPQLSVGHGPQGRRSSRPPPARPAPLRALVVGRVRRHHPLSSCTRPAHAVSLVPDQPNRGARDCRRAVPRTDQRGGAKRRQLQQRVPGAKPRASGRVWTRSA
jgi:hypothetical protein